MVILRTLFVPGYSVAMVLGLMVTQRSKCTMVL